VNIQLDSLITQESQKELVRHLRNLIRIDTTNPPGNEIEAARYIADVLLQEHIEPTILEPSPGRGNLIARLKGAGSKRPLLLMSHLDVVAADAKQWQHHPFEAEIHDDYVWGRGSVDCKNTVALWMMILLLLKRAHVVPKRDLVLLATADEESGHRHGMEWLVNNHYDLVDAEAALNEGGGFGMEFSDQMFFTFQSAEKGNIWLNIVAKGTPGHASIPRRDNPVRRIAALSEKLARMRYPVQLTPSVQEMLDHLAATRPPFQEKLFKMLLKPWSVRALISLAVRDEFMADGIRAMLSNTLCPTVLKAGSKVNVIPEEAACQIDHRILPGYELNEAVDDLIQRIGPDFEVEIMDTRPATESRLDHELVGSIKKVLQQQCPDAKAIPLLSTGSTDASFLRSRGMAVYGFSPMLQMDEMNLAHANDERISLESLAFSLEVGLAVVLDYIM